MHTTLTVLNVISCAEMNKDLDVLLDCISYQLDDPSSLSQALLTIARMCTGNGKFFS